MLKKIMLLNIFVEAVMQFFRIIWWTESSKEQHLFETDYLTFDQFNASLLNKSNNFFQKIPTEPSLLNYLSTTFEVF